MPRYKVCQTCGKEYEKSPASYRCYTCFMKSDNDKMNIYKKKNYRPSKGYKKPNRNLVIGPNLNKKKFKWVNNICPKEAEKIRKELLG